VLKEINFDSHFSRHIDLPEVESQFHLRAAVQERQTRSGLKAVWGIFRKRFEKISNITFIKNKLQKCNRKGKPEGLPFRI
jgi:hypothetical protein